MRFRWLQQIGFASCVIFFTMQCRDVIYNVSIAQIIPDNTLPTQSTVRQQDNTRIIEGGTQAGSNLFHSFSEFSIPNGSTAFFNNVLNIQNILTRVTGNSISNIDGLIRANGTANLFLINPNGIIFGQNARLDIGGSFFATSASGIKFASGFEFSAKNPQPTPLLTISAPIGLQFGANPGLIQVQGNGRGRRNFNSPIIDTQDALRVQPDKTLALVGGDINLEGATLKTAGGRIELASVKGNGLVSLTPTNTGFALDYGDVQNFGNIQLSQRATVDASGEGGGDIQVQGKGITLMNSSSIQTSTLGAKQGGDLVVNATESIEASRSSGLFALTYPKATGNAGNLTINTRKLLVRDEARVSAVTFGAGKGGNLSVNAQDVQLIGTTASNPTSTGFSVSAQPNSTGDAGNLTIKTNTLLLRDGAQVGAFTSGAGKGGNLSVDAQEVQLIGTTANGQYPSGLAVSAEESLTGDAGSLKIKTNTLLLRDGAQVSAATFGAGKGGNLSVDAQNVQLIGRGVNNRLPSALGTSAQRNSTGNSGDLTIKTNTLIVRNGAEVSTDTYGAGKGGNLSVDAQEVQVIGKSANNRFSSSLGASAKLNSTGDAGNLTVTTGTLLVQAGAEVNVQSSGTGTAGNMTLNARSIRLDNNALLTANTQSAKVNPNREQATININSKNLLMRHNSNIITNATGKNVIGGNINIGADVLAVFENSRISANSANSRGGRVTINAEGIFPAAFRDYITATGATPDSSGTLQFNIRDTDLSRGLVPLTIDVVDVARLVDNNICARTAYSSFTYTGRGGLPPSPNNALNSNAVWEDWQLTAVPREREQKRDREQTEENNSSPPTQLVEAQGWIINQNGEVTLTAYAPTATLNPIGSSSLGCQQLSK